MKRTNRRFRTRAIVLATSVMLVVPPANAATDQMNATDDPEVTGALELETDGCRRQQEQYRGEVVAKGKTCLRIYTFDPTAESDDERNYGVVWLQSNLNSSRGWCGSKVLSDVDLPNDIRVESRAPKTIELNRRKAYRTELSVDAAGNAVGDPASIAQDQVLYPEKVRGWVMDAENVFRLKWTGMENAKLGFASGAEISWTQGESPGGISFRLNYQLRRGRC
jgi:hypothetical protein